VRPVVPLVQASVAALLLAGCQAMPGEGSMTREEALAALASTTEAVTGRVGGGWARRAEPSTMSCGTMGGGSGRRWVDEASGAVDWPADDAVAAATEALEGEGLSVSVDADGDPVTRIALRATGGARELSLVLSLRSDGVARLNAESACF